MLQVHLIKVLLTGHLCLCQLSTRLKEHLPLCQLTSHSKRQLTTLRPAPTALRADPTERQLTTLRPAPTALRAEITQPKELANLQVVQMELNRTQDQVVIGNKHHLDHNNILNLTDQTDLGTTLLHGTDQTDLGTTLLHGTDQTDLGTTLLLQQMHRLN